MKSIFEGRLSQLIICFEKCFEYVGFDGNIDMFAWIQNLFNIIPPHIPAENEKNLIELLGNSSLKVKFCCIELTGSLQLGPQRHGCISARFLSSLGSSLISPSELIRRKAKSTRHCFQVKISKQKNRIKNIFLIFFGRGPRRQRCISARFLPDWGSPLISPCELIPKKAKSARRCFRVKISTQKNRIKKISSSSLAGAPGGTVESPPDFFPLGNPLVSPCELIPRRRNQPGVVFRSKSVNPKIG
ncbi:hypothetical protein CEXT_794281 [Caerostris extrusa]|uniref:Uncharacterized protein n=1 Tax=Caerostris extrusa TaxID=172846 RepID=A0AAV4XRE0_CAEEX|nr:hypothetical protein CEXT_794281 [Caerostris extrusa]